MQVNRSAIDPVCDRVVVVSEGLPLSREKAFRLFTQESELQTWLCEAAKVEPRIGGRYELFWNPNDPENDSTLGCRFTAFLPEALIGFQWRSPRQFKAFANAADPLTHVVVSFHETSGGTVVTLVHSGWRSSTEWADAAAWQEMAWKRAFQALVARARILAGTPA